MEFLPFPKTRHGWLAALLLAGLAFLSYYQLAYQKLLNYYESHFYWTWRADPLEDPLQKLNIQVRVPQAFSTSMERWIFVQVRNTDDRALKDIRVDVIILGERQIPMRPFMFMDVQVFERAILFPSIEPQAVLTGRIPVLVGEGDKGKLTIRVNGQRVNFVGEIPPVEVDEGEALFHSTVENLLLPPWSNGILPLLVFVTCYLLERRGNMAGAQEWIDFRRVFFGGLFIVLMVFVLIGVLIWDPTGWLGQTAKWVLVVLAGFGLIIVGWFCWEQGPWEQRLAKSTK